MGKDDVGNARFMFSKPIQLRCNNTVVIHIANNQVFHVKTSVRSPLCSRQSNGGNH